MNYIGSKKHLLDFISTQISLHVSKPQTKVFCDLFSGTASVGEHFRNTFASIIANDIEPFAYVLSYNKIKNLQNFETAFVTQNYSPKEGFIFEHFAKKRSYFSLENAKKIDGIRYFLQNSYANKMISQDAYYFYLASLIFSADRVANTTGVYGSYLKELKFMAKSSMKYLPHSVNSSQNSSQNRVYNEDATTLIEKIEGDVLYLDPPYNHRQYGLNYHVLNAIASYEEFEPRGVCGYNDYFRSEFCQIKRCEQALDEIVKKAKFETILLSYSADGILDTMSIEKILSKHGDYSRCSFDHPRYRTQKNSKKGHVKEYLHVVHKNGV